MDLIEDSVDAPRFTRWVRALLLGSVEGMSMGLGLGLLRVSGRILPFVTTNRSGQGVRQSIIAAMVACAVTLPSLLVLSCALPNAIGRRLRAFELRTRLLSPLTAVGCLPLLFQPELWKDKMLGFLLMTAVFSIAVTLSSEAALTAAGQIKLGPRMTDLVTLVRALRVRISPRSRLLLSVSTISLLALCGLVRTFSSAKAPIPAAVAEWTIVHKFSTYGDFTLWFTGIGSRALGHTSILGAVYSVWTWIWPKPEGLLWLRLCAVIWPAWPLLLWTRKSLGNFAGWCMAAAYLSMPIKALLTADDTFPVSYAVGLFFLCGYFLDRKRFGYAVLTAFATIAVNEQAAVWIAALGLFFAARERNAPWSIWLSLVAASYFAYVAFVLLPHAGVLSYTGGAPTMPRPIHTAIEPLANSLLNPAYAVPRWLDNQTVEFWLLLLLPLGWLPLRNSRWFAWLLPVIVLSYLARFACDWRTSTFTHFATLAIVSSIGSLGRLKRSGEVSRARYVSVYAGWLAALLPCVTLLGSLWRPID